MPGLKDQLFAEREAHRRARYELDRLRLLLEDFVDAASDAVQSGGDPCSIDMLKGVLLRFRESLEA